MTEYKPEIFTESYINSRNILSLCYRDLDKNISKQIDSYLVDYAAGFALFGFMEYYLSCYIKIISKFCSIKNEESNKILKKINNIHNYKRIELKLDIYDLSCIENIILKDKLNIENNTKVIGYIKMKNNNININGTFTKRIKYISNTINPLNSFYKKLNTLEEYIIQRANINDFYYNKDEEIDRKNLCYAKELIINNYIIKFDITRPLDIKKSKNKIKIPYILDLPDFVFDNNEKQKYELIAVIIFDNNKLKYSCIIKENDNNYYHYLYDKIIKTNNKYFDKYTSYNATELFYRII